MNWVLIDRAMLTVAAGSMLVEAWGTFVGPAGLVGPFAALALVLFISSLFIRRLVS